MSCGASWTTTHGGPRKEACGTATIDSITDADGRFQTRHATLSEGRYRSVIRAPGFLTRRTPWANLAVRSGA